jgi:predicted metal-dependent peptidase
MAKKQNRKKEIDQAANAFHAGEGIVSMHPMFHELLSAVSVYRDASQPFPRGGLVSAGSGGQLICNPEKRATPGRWARAIAHSLLHFGMCHFQAQQYQREWNTACDLVIEKLLNDLKFGEPAIPDALPSFVSDENKTYAALLQTPEDERRRYNVFGTAGTGEQDMIFTEDSWHYKYYGKPPEWDKLFASGISASLRIAVDIAAGVREGFSVSAHKEQETSAERARQWFISSYPLLGAVAARFKLIEDPIVCQRMSVSIAAVSPALSEIYINPAAGLPTDEMRFVLAHEFMHAALRHDARQEWRDAYIWNVACDFVINRWLTEMGVGERPAGVLYDEQFSGMSAEEIYDRIVTDIRMYRKLATLRGIGLGDILSGEESPSVDEDLDAFYRRALSQGLSYHEESGRGYLPAALVEEIRALSHPPIPWDVRLARWFEEQFAPIEKRLSYARPSRRQSSSPDIPRPGWVTPPEALERRTFGVVLDTSGSMDRALLAIALGAIASFSASRDVPAARVVFCDAEAYDQGYMKPEDIAGSVKVKGRGGTILQPGIDILLRAEDFPEDAPLLIITDGECENRLTFKGREHAFLIPQGSRLPFVAKGKVFRFRF